MEFHLLRRQPSRPPFAIRGKPVPIRFFRRHAHPEETANRMLDRFEYAMRYSQMPREAQKAFRKNRLVGIRALGRYRLGYYHDNDYEAYGEAPDGPDWDRTDRRRFDAGGFVEVNCHLSRCIVQADSLVLDGAHLVHTIVVDSTVVGVELADGMIFCNEIQNEGIDE